MPRGGRREKYYQPRYFCSFLKRTRESQSILEDTVGIIKNTITLSVLWIIAITCSFSWNYYSAQKEQERLAFLSAEAFFQQVVLTRRWNAEHGGVYVKITPKTQPNPYLKTENRDLQFSPTLTLTKINPAFMTRQISEVANEIKGIQFHITSLTPLNPQNKPTELEAKYLRLFHLGTISKKGEVLRGQDKDSYFFMAPLITEKTCLSCHAQQGYKEGNIRGGISVKLPFSSTSVFPMAITHLAIGILGLSVLTICGRKQKMYIKEIETLAATDSLTKIPNRRNFSERILHTCKQNKIAGESLSIIMCDIDNFKKFNDTYGHCAGDQCLIKIAQKLQDSLNRPNDFCARYGGEEFIICLVGTDPSGSMTVAERLRSSVESMRIEHVASPPKNIVTISLGVASLESNSLVSYEKLIQYADKALYQAKKSGGNQIRFYQRPTRHDLKHDQN